MKTFLISILIGTMNYAFSQEYNGTINWQKAYGGTSSEHLYNIKNTDDGGYIIAGYTYSEDVDITQNFGRCDYWIIKLDSEGNKMWQKSYGGSEWEMAYDISQTYDGGYILVGHSNSNDGHVSMNNGEDDFWIVRLDEFGEIIWQKSYGGSHSEWPFAVKQSSDGSFVIAGWSDSNDGDVSGNHGLRDYWILKLDPLGNLIWEKSLGGSGQDIARSIDVTFDGGYIIAGYTYSEDGDVTDQVGSSDYWIVKLDVDGNISWEKSLGSPGFDNAFSIEQTMDFGYIVAGCSNGVGGNVSGNKGSSDYWVVKLDVSGDIIWEKNLGGTGTDMAQSISQTNDGGYIVGGLSYSDDGDVSGNHGSSDYWIVKLNSNGSIEWELNVGGSELESARSVVQSPDGTFTLAGNTRSNDGDISENQGAYDYWVVNLCASFSSTDTISACDTYMAPDGQVYDQSGIYTSVIPNTSACDSTLIIDLTINHSNEYSQVETALDSFTWPVNGQTYTDSGIYMEVLTNQAGCDSTVVLNLSMEYTGLEENMSLNLKVYPNPTTNLITIQSESVLNNEFKIYDQQGREVMNGKLTGKNTEVSFDKLSRGTYTIQVDGNYKPAVIIKQ